MGIPPSNRSHLPVAERGAVSRVHFLLAKPGLLHGSLQVIASRCGKKGCHCADGKGHPSLRLYVMQKDRQISLHVPASWGGRVREWIKRDREVRELLVDISTHYVARLRKRKE